MCMCTSVYAYKPIYTSYIHVYTYTYIQGHVHRPARRHHTHGQAVFRARAQFGPGRCPVPGGGSSRQQRCVYVYMCDGIE